MIVKNFAIFWKTRSRKYAQACGKNVDRNFERGKEQDLLKRMGNSVLNAVKQKTRWKKKEKIF